MALTLTATPLPDLGSVRLAAVTDAPTDPVVVLDLDAAAIAAEGLAAWSGTVEAISLYDDLVAFYSVSSYGTATRVLDGLTPGRRYRVTLTVALSAAATTFTVADAEGVVPVGTALTPVTVEFVATATSHDLTLNTVLNDQPGLARLEVIDAPEPVSWTLTRSDVNGTRPVRLYEGQDNVGGALVVTDAEPALVGQVLYSAQAGEDAASVMTTLEGLSSRSRIAPASMPSQGQWFDLAPAWTLGRDTTSTTAQVINRPDPLVTLGSQTLRRGTLEIFCEDYTAGTALEATFNLGEVVFIRQPDYPGLDMYVIGTSTALTIQPEMTDPRRWVLEVEYTEVAAPTTPLRGSIGWTFAASQARNPTFAASRAEFPTFLDLLLGPDA